MSSLATIKLATLIEDLALYPRHRVDETHINDLVRALQAGSTLPPIVVDRKSKRIVDGVHRCRALLKHLGEDASAKVDFRTYDTDADFFKDAVALNSSHGRKLDRHDQTRIVLKCQELNLPTQEIALVLHIPEPQVQYLSLRIVHADAGEAVPLKRGLEHMRGQTITEQQRSTMASVRSAEGGRIALELMRLLDADLVDLSDECTVERLKALATAISRALSAVAA